MTLTQPWATLVAIGAKKIETRSWPTRYRGPLAIHAAKAFPSEAWHFCFDWDCLGPFYKNGIKGPEELPRGAVLAVCRLVDCIPTSDVIGRIYKTAEERLGDYSPGRWAWLLEDVRRLDAPVPAKGRLGLWDINDGLLEDVETSRHNCQKRS